MSWTEANIARRRNITDLTGNISRQAANMAQLREAEKVRKQQAMRDFQNTLTELTGRKFGAEEAEKERDWRTGERVGAQDYGTGERLGMQEYETGEREAGQEFTKDVELPWRLRIAGAGRAEQNVYAGGDQTMAAFDKGFASWMDKAGSQHPDWFIKDEYGEVIGYNIPDEGWAQFKQYMGALHPNITGAQVDAYIDSIRAMTTEEPEVPPSASGKPSASRRAPLSSSIQGLVNMAKRAGSSPNMSFEDRRTVAEWIDNITRNTGKYETDENLYQKQLEEIMAMIEKYAATAEYGYQQLEGF